jgi:hypothetical protein
MRRRTTARPRVEYPPYPPGRNPYKSYDQFNGRRVDNFRLYVCLRCGAMEWHSFHPGDRRHVFCKGVTQVQDEFAWTEETISLPCWSTLEEIHDLGVDPAVIPVVYAMGGPEALKAVIDEHRKEKCGELSE